MLIYAVMWGSIPIKYYMRYERAEDHINRLEPDDQETYWIQDIEVLN